MNLELANVGAATHSKQITNISERRDESTIDLGQISPKRGSPQSQPVLSMTSF